MIKYSIVILVLLTISAYSDVLDDIDRTVEHISRFVLSSVSDDENNALIISPFLCDKIGRNILGDRLKSEIELFLSGQYKKTCIIEQPIGLNVYNLNGEIQIYTGRIRILCKLLRPNGILEGGTKTDISISSELEALLKPSQKSSLEPSQPEDDPYEPDDMQGFEVDVTSLNTNSFTRILTPGDVDRFRFYLHKAGTVVLNTAADIGIQILLYKEGERIPFAVNDNWNQQSRLETHLDEGYYIAELLAYDFNIQGKYTFVIDLSGRINDSFEPDNNLKEAKSILPDEEQLRELLPGDEDWIELSFNVPGFYSVFTKGHRIDTVLSVFNKNEVEIISDDNSGELHNAHIGLFLGISQMYIRVSAVKNDSGGSYVIVFMPIDPPTVFPDGSVEILKVQDAPHFLKLRILKPGNYVVKIKEGSVSFDIYSLPRMKHIPVIMDDSHYSLPSGDYLINVKNPNGEKIQLSIALAGG